MPRKTKFNHKRHRELKKIYQTLRLEEKLRAMRRARKIDLPESVDLFEKTMIDQLEAYRRSERFEAMELELVNFERKAAGLRPLDRFPVDPAVEQAAIDFERRRGRDPGRVGRVGR